MSEVTHRLRRIAAYGRLSDESGRVLLVRASAVSANKGRWFLPGGGVDHGEHPAQTVVREVAEETGLRVAVAGLGDVITDVELLPDGTLRHQDRLIFDVTLVGGALRAEVGGSTDRAAWVEPADLAGLPLMPHVARALGVVPGSAPALAAGAPPGVVPVDAGPVDAGDGILRFQRFAAYGLVRDPSERLLLTLIATGYPGAGLWHLPGGGTDFGENAADGLIREIREESDQRARITGVLAVSHRRHDHALGPEGVPIDWHGVRVIYNARVDEPTLPVVVERVGSTQAAGWFTPEQACGLALTEVAGDMIRTYAL